MATAWTVERYDALCEAISLGALEMEYDGKKVKYRSLREMLALRRQAEQALGLSEAPSRAHYPVFKDGTA